MDNCSTRIRHENPREGASPISAATFWYVIPTLIKGYGKDLTEADLTETFSEHKSKFLSEKLYETWESMQAQAKNKKNPSLRKALLKVFGLEFILYGIAVTLSEALKLLQPFTIGKLMRYYSPNNKDMTKQEAVMYAIILVVSSTLSTLIMHPYLMGCYHLGMKLRVACCCLIYRKSLRLSQSALSQKTIGLMLNLLSNDVNKFDTSMVFFHHVWIAPLETLVVSVFLYEMFGPWSLAGLFVLLSFIPLLICVSKTISKLCLKTALKTDERVRTMSEIIDAMQVIKMYTWEKAFSTVVSSVRRSEIKLLRRTGYLRGVVQSLPSFNTRLAIAALLACVVFSDQDINAEKIFVLVSYYTAIRSSLTILFPSGVTSLSEVNVTLTRLSKFLALEERHQSQKYKHQIRFQVTLKGFGGLTEVVEENGVKIKNGFAQWNKDCVQYTLFNITLTAQPATLTAIIGPVGSGKSSLLQCILGELPLTEGSVTTTGIISYASQDMWLFSGNVRQNILFGMKFEEQRYKKVVEICALEKDLSLLPYGDQTLVGDKGIMMSGGQKARINLARALYRKADIYLLDDPLSAVDAKVGKQLFKKCVKEFLRDKIVILVTHQQQYLRGADQIICLQDGHIASQGSLDELSQNNLDLSKIFDKTEEEALQKKEIKRLNSSISSKSLREAPMTVEESMSKGRVDLTVFKEYLKATGTPKLNCLILLLFIFVTILASYSDYFLCVWANAQDSNKNQTMVNFNSNVTISSSDMREINKTYGIIFTAMLLILVVSTLMRSFLFFNVCTRASSNIHNNLFDSISRASLKFFNDNPAGRILNRFSKDMGTLDVQLPNTMIDSFQTLLSLLGTVCVLGFVNPIFLIPVAFICLIFNWLRIFYLRTSSDMKRLEGVARSPIFCHIHDTLDGMTTIRAFGSQDMLLEEFYKHQDLHSSAWYGFISVSRAFGYWLDIISLVYIALVTFCSFMSDKELQGGYIGLVITQALAITGTLQWGMRQLTEVENQITSLERINEYNSIDHECDTIEERSKQLKSTWPERGEIIFRSVFLRYSSTEQPVLRNVNFLVEPKEKVGVVGRTGAGKSSLINALFQLAPTSGRILIDDIDIAQISLHDLRSKLFIIPQEPLLFSGSLKRNLDPFDKYSDETLWKSLEDVEMKKVITNLNIEVSAGGSNFSVGQRQLLCLARAILNRSKILVLDEATANIDQQTDTLIQSTIRQKFADCTVLTVAHRLHTIMDSDKVLVMDAGTVKEFDHPYKLLQNKEGIFYNMVQETGQPTSDMLYKTAEEHNLLKENEERNT